VRTARRSARAPVIGLALLLGVLTTPALAQMQMGPPAPSVPPDRLRAQASAFEKKGQWKAAFDIYCQLIAADRQNADYKGKLQLCLRHVLQDFRLRDSSFQERVLPLPYGQVLALYGEVIGKLQTQYVDRDKTLPTRLFQQGLQEFDAALGDEGFRGKFLKGIPEPLVQEFRRRLRDAWTERTVASAQEAQALVGEVAVAARRDLHFPKEKLNAVVLEFLCGACNSLDEFTAYLTPSQLLAELAAEPDAPTVVETAMLKDGIGYTRITHFRDSTPQEFDAALSMLKMTAGLRILILDLRGNPGGSFVAAVQIAERFLPQGVIVSTAGQTTEFNKVYTSAAGAAALDWRLYILVDGDTASAAEVLAGALRDHQRALLVGTPTYGKGTIQCLIQFATAQESDEHAKPRSRTGAVRMTLARIFSPSGQALSGGIMPHMLEPNKEHQLDAALEDASRFVSMMHMP
jgi:hypothetical protein